MNDKYMMHSTQIIGISEREQSNQKRRNIYKITQQLPRSEEYSFPDWKVPWYCTGQHLKACQPEISEYWELSYNLPEERQVTYEEPKSERLQSNWEQYNQYTAGKLFFIYNSKSNPSINQVSGWNQDIYGHAKSQKLSKTSHALFLRKLVEATLQ